MRWIAAMLVLLCQAAHAQVVYKCAGKDGRTEYSSWPCTAGQMTRQAIPAPPDPVARYIPPAPRQSPAPSHGQANYSAVQSPAQQERAARDAACNQAKRHREATLASVGLKRNFDLLRRLDDTVRTACGGL